VVSATAAILLRSPQLRKNGGLSVSPSIEETEKVGWMRDYSHVVFGKKFPGEKGSVKRCVVVIQQQVLLSPKFGAKSSHIFTQSPTNVTVECGIDCLACQDELFVNDPLDVKGNYEHVLHFALRLPCILSKTCAKFDAVPLSDPSRNHIRPDTQLQV
jgi:hypothetical protein